MNYPYQTVNINNIVYTDRNESLSIANTIKKGKNIVPDGNSIVYLIYIDNSIINILVLLIKNMLPNSYFPHKLI